MARKPKTATPAATPSRAINTNFQHHRAAMALAAEYDRTAVIKEAGISMRTLERWLSFGWFEAMVEDYARKQREQVLAQLENEGITSRANRLQILQRRLMQVGAEIDDAYASLEEFRDNSPNQRKHLPDAILDRIKLEMALAKQGAQESGQWAERINLSQLTDEQVTDLLGILPDESDEGIAGTTAED